MLENSLVTSLTVGLTNSESAGSVRANAAVSYRLTRYNTITLNVKSTGFNSSVPGTPGYSEYTTSLTMSQKL